MRWSFLLCSFVLAGCVLDRVDRVDPDDGGVQAMDVPPGADLIPPANSDASPAEDAPGDLAEAIPETCNDLVDNDGDGAIDCYDAQCAQDPLCLTIPGDSCASPIELPALDSYILNVTGQTAQTSGSCGGLEGRDVVLRFTLTEETAVTITAGSPSFILYLRSQGCEGAELACGQGEIALNALPGAYILFVDYSDGTEWTSTEIQVDRRSLAPCDDGDERFCELSQGVCEGSRETCAGSLWPGCDYASLEDHESPELTCQDGLDNDCDGLGDCQDNDCDGQPCDSLGRVCSLGLCWCPLTAEDCANGRDDDCNGLVDCQDPACPGQPCGRDTVCAEAICQPGGRLLGLAQFPTGTGDELAQRIHALPGDGFLLAGEFTGATTLGDGADPRTPLGPGDLFAAQYQGLDSLEWSFVAGSANPSPPSKVYAMDVSPEGEIFLGALFGGNLTLGETVHNKEGHYATLLVRLSPDGEVLDSASIFVTGGQGDDSFSVLDLAVLASGQVAATGHFAGTVPPPVGPLTSLGTKADIWLALFDPDLSLNWIETYGGEDEDDSGFALEPLDDGGFLLSGAFCDTIYLGRGNETWRLDSTPKEDSLLFSYDLMVARLNSAGGVIWATSAGGAGNDVAGDMAVQDDAVLVVGYFEENIIFGDVVLPNGGDADTFIARYTLEGGDLVWLRHITGPESEWLKSLVALPGGGAIACGSFEGEVHLGEGANTRTLTSAGESDILIVRYDGQGNLLWARRAGGPGRDECWDMSLKGESVLITGELNQHLINEVPVETYVEFDGQYRGPLEGRDIFVAEYSW